MAHECVKFAGGVKAVHLVQYSPSHIEATDFAS